MNLWTQMMHSFLLRCHTFSCVLLYPSYYSSVSNWACIECSEILTTPLRCTCHSGGAGGDWMAGGGRLASTVVTYCLLAVAVDEMKGDYTRGWKRGNLFHGLEELLQQSVTCWTCRKYWNCGGNICASSCECKASVASVTSLHLIPKPVFSVGPCQCVML